MDIVCRLRGHTVTKEDAQDMERKNSNKCIPLRNLKALAIKKDVSKSFRGRSRREKIRREGKGRGGKERGGEQWGGERRRGEGSMNQKIVIKYLHIKAGT